ncbi:MAG: arginase family protein [Pseudomonadales bacterium]|jgi:arginase|nr:arginase family protein [Pseudomonadales bacterium]
MKQLATALILYVVWSLTAAAAEPIPVALVINGYAGDRAGPEKDTDAMAMAQGGLPAIIGLHGGVVVALQEAELDDGDAGAYGRWNRYGIVSGHFADRIVVNRRDGLFNIGLYNNCSGALGMLGGLRHSDPEGPLRVGMVWIDAHGDYNTPETSLSGMLGGMPVAIAAGDGLQRMRQQARIDDPLTREELLMVAVRDTDPLEQARIDAHGLARLDRVALRRDPARIRAEIDRLGDIVDLIYVHVDLDVLDPAEVPWHPLQVADGPTSTELADAIAIMFEHPKAAAFGIASYPHDADPDGVTLTAIQRLVAGAMRGLSARPDA